MGESEEMSHENQKRIFNLKNSENLRRKVKNVFFNAQYGISRAITFIVKLKQQRMKLAEALSNRG
jgi:hypothetical protein